MNVTLAGVGAEYVKRLGVAMVWPPQGPFLPSRAVLAKARKIIELKITTSFLGLI
jgi:hypothetical protein